MNRRPVIALAALAVAGLIGLGLLAVLAGDDDRRAGALVGGTAVAAENWVLRVDNQLVGQLASVETCGPVVAVVLQNVSHTSGQPTQTATAGEKSQTSCVLRFKPFQDPALVAWLNQTLNGQVVKRDLDVEAYSADGQGILKLQLDDSLIRQIVFPRVTPGISGAYVVTVSVQPQAVVRQEPFNDNFLGDPPESVAGFQLKIDGQSVSDVRGVGPIVVDQQLSELHQSTPNGGVRTVYQPGQLTVQQLKVTTEPDPQSPLANWFSSVVGAQTQAALNQSKQVTLSLLGGNQQPGLNIVFPSMGIANATDSPDLTERTYSLYLRTSRSLALSVPPPPASPAPPATPPPPPPTETTVAAPKELTAKLRSASDAELQWSPVEKVEGYVILMALSPGGDYIEVARSAEPSAVVSKLEGGPPYYFVVRAYVGETQSENSPEAEATG